MFAVTTMLTRAAPGAMWSSVTPSAWLAWSSWNIASAQARANVCGSWACGSCGGSLIAPGR